MVDFCDYRDLTGIPGKGMHSLRFMNISVLDTVGTIFGAYIAARFFKINFGIVLVLAFVSGIIAHRLFCVDTTVDKALFGKK